MNKSIERAPPSRQRTRRDALGLLGASAAMLGMEFAPGSALGQSDDETVLTEALVLRDPDIPAAGNVNGDISIVEYFDYQ
jgi:protein-disulfide isomerase